MLLRYKTFLTGCSMAGLILASAGVVANEGDAADRAMHDKQSQEATVAKNSQQQSDQELAGPQEDVQEAAAVLAQLKEINPEFAQQLADAKGIFVIPDYATASLLVGGSGGEGVLLTQSQGQWGNPSFYDIGNIDIGAQAGAAAGSLVMGLMSDQALQPFEASGTDFSLTAEAGLTIVNWSAEAPAVSGEGDVVMWTDTEGLLAEASLGVGGISFDEEEAAEYYGQSVQAQQVLAGNVQNPHEQTVQSEFAEFSTATQSQSGAQSTSMSDYERPSKPEYEVQPETQPQYENQPEAEQ